MNYIYTLTNLINSKQYIGKTSNFGKRMREHLSASRTCSDNSIIHKAIRKYGIENFHIECLCVNGNVDLWEKHLIKRWKTKIPNGYNMTDGGEGILGFTWVCNKPAWNKGVQMTDAAKANLSEYWSGKRLGKQNGFSRAIVMIHPDDTEERFDSIADACRKYNLWRSPIIQVLKGRYKQHNGFRFKYNDNL